MRRTRINRELVILLRAMGVPGRLIAARCRCTQPYVSILWAQRERIIGGPRA